REEDYAEPGLLMKMIDPRDRDHLKEIAAGRAYADGAPYVLRWVRKDGKTIWTEQRLFVELGDDGEPDAFQGIVREVTERREADAELRAALATSRQLVDELRRKTLSGSLPICSHCKNNRNRLRHWGRIDAPIS